MKRRSPAFFFAALFLLGLPAAAAAVDFLFSWSADPDPAVTGYAVYRRTAGGDWQKIEELPLSAFEDPERPEYLVAGLSAGATYWFAASSLYGFGGESALFATTCIRVGDTLLDCSDPDPDTDGTRLYVSCFLSTAAH